MSRRQPTSYKELKVLWYARLKKSGFNDIEDINAPDLRLNNADAFSKSDKYGQHTPEWRRSKEEYYQMASYFLNHYKFESNIDRIVWEYATNSIGSYAIVDTLKKTKISMTLFEVKKILQRLKKVMLLGAYEEVEDKE